MKLTRMIRTAGWLTVAGLLGAALIAPSGALATPDGNPPTSELECAGYAYYFKIQAPFDGTFESGDADVETNWAGQVITISNGANEDQQFDWASTQAVLKVAVKSGPDYFYPTIASGGLSGTVDNANQNDISHVTWCGNPVTTTTTTTDETTADETTADETTTTTTTDETTADETTTTTTTTTTDETTADETTTTTTTDETTADETTTTSTPDGEVKAAVGTPDPTLPSTDTASISGGSTTTGSTWQLLLVAMAGLLATILLLTPATVARKR